MGADLVRELVAKRIIELGLTKAEVSRRLEHNPTYMYQYLVKGSPVELAERERAALAAILRVPEDDLRGPSSRIPARNYGLNVAPRKNNVVELSHPAYIGVPESRILVDNNLIGTVVDLPVFGTSQGGENGAIMLSEAAVDWVARPPMLAHVRDAYAVIVPRNKMEPVVRSGSIVMFHPHLPPRFGDMVLFRSLRDGVMWVLGAEYRGETSALWKAHHYKPDSNFELNKSEWQACHRAVGAYYP